MDDYSPTRGRGVRAAKVQRARELRRNMTQEEDILWQQLRKFRGRGYAFRRQHVISGFIVDFYCYAARLVVEVDGGIHEQQADYDAERDVIIAAHGLRILRVTNDDVRQNLSAVIKRITAAITSSSSSSSSSHTPLSPQGEGPGVRTLGGGEDPWRG